MMKLNEVYAEQYQEFTSRLRQARLDAGLSQEEVAERLGVSQSFVSRSENGERRVDVIELQALATLYQKSFAYFIR